ncbi:hypothetical protein [Burkholderia ubonensis]|uniref:hypothetical protein n=1 Tax=Burkholderia ubonensis TaxID=101571 RepID=UPI0012FBBA32|nr:hypothetical protein [Burkholderia ubonensis]
MSSQGGNAALARDVHDASSSRTPRSTLTHFDAVLSALPHNREIFYQKLVNGGSDSSAPPSENRGVLHTNPLERYSSAFAGGYPYNHASDFKKLAYNSPIDRALNIVSKLNKNEAITQEEANHLENTVVDLSLQLASTVPTSSAIRSVSNKISASLEKIAVSDGRAELPWIPNASKALKNKKPLANLVSEAASESTPLLTQDTPLFSDPKISVAPGGKPIDNEVYSENVLRLRGGGNRKTAGEISINQPAAKNHESDIAPNVNSGSTGSVQNRLTDSYWKGRLINKNPKEFAKTQNPGFWESYVSENDATKTAPRKLDDVVHLGKDLLGELDKKPASAPQLKLYRGMKEEEARKLLDWSKNRKSNVEDFVRHGGVDEHGQKLTPKDLNSFLKDKNDPGIMPIRGHVGDYNQAKTYGSKPGEKVVEITLKPGAEELLYSPDYMALVRRGKGANASLASFEKLSTRKIFPQGSGSEGNLPGYIGMKPEGRGDYSLAMGESDPTHLMFQMFVDDIRVVDA